MNSILNIEGVTELTRKQKQCVTAGSSDNCDNGEWHIYLIAPLGIEYMVCIPYEPQHEGH